MWREWKTTFSNVVEMHSPSRTRWVRLSASPWITPELKKNICMKGNILKIKAIRSKDTYDWAAFKLVKKAYYMQAFYENESNVKKTWGIINEPTSKKQNDSLLYERE